MRKRRSLDKTPGRSTNNDGEFIRFLRLVSVFDFQTLVLGF